MEKVLGSGTITAKLWVSDGAQCIAGRWRSTLVAIKVVEHSPGARESLSLAEQKIEREALLATSLSHPNIIATFKICTMTAGAMPCSLPAC